MNTTHTLVTGQKSQALAEQQPDTMDSFDVFANL